jgi:hypothetical protein
VDHHGLVPSQAIDALYALAHHQVPCPKHHGSACFTSFFAGINRMPGRMVA